jgi:hypothetical protein
LCAQAMQDECVAAREFLEEGHRGGYEPLINDEQAMRLLKRFELYVSHTEMHKWAVGPRDYSTDEAASDDLNRAIVECVAMIQAAK